jgi:hypothetical protein
LIIIYEAGSGLTVGGLSTAGAGGGVGTTSAGISTTGFGTEVTAPPLSVELLFEVVSVLLCAGAV